MNYSWIIISLETPDYLTNFWCNNWRSIFAVVERLCYCQHTGFSWDIGFCSVFLMKIRGFVLWQYVLYVKVISTGQFSYRCLHGCQEECCKKVKLETIKCMYLQNLTLGQNEKKPKLCPLCIVLHKGAPQTRIY